jgi:hypothetical protein
MPGPYKTISEIKAANKAAGLFFFERKTMRFFESKAFPYVYGGRYFVTYEGKINHLPYAVRMACDDGDIYKSKRFHTRQEANDHAAMLGRLDKIDPDARP